MKTYVSLWSADLLNVGAAIDRVDDETEGFHIDVTDGHLSPQLLFGPDFVAAVRKRTGKLIDVHLMVRDADAWVGPFIDVGADMVTIHRRTTADPATTFDAITSCGVMASLAIEVYEALPQAGDAVWSATARLLLMGTEIGVKGVEPDPGLYQRIRTAVTIRDTLPHRPEVFVDGGIREHSVPLIAQAGADGVIPGSLVYAADDPVGALRHLHRLNPG